MDGMNENPTQSPEPHQETAHIPDPIAQNAQEAPKIEVQAAPKPKRAYKRALPFKCLEDEQGRRKMITPRMLKAAQLVREGVPVAHAMTKAGYSPSSLTGAPHGTLKDMIREAQEDYLSQFVNESKKINFSGRFAAQRLKRIATKNDGNPKTDFNAILAIREHGRLMTKIATDHGTVNLTGTFIIPASAPNGWEDQASAAVKQAEQAFLSVDKTVDSVDNSTLLTNENESARDNIT